MGNNSSCPHLEKSHPNLVMPADTPSFSTLDLGSNWLPRSGDFSRIPKSSVIGSSNESNPTTRRSDPTSCARLGDLRKVIHRIRASPPTRDTLRSAFVNGDPLFERRSLADCFDDIIVFGSCQSRWADRFDSLDKQLPEPLQTWPAGFRRTQSACFLSDFTCSSESESHLEPDPSARTPASTPPSATGRRRFTQPSTASQKAVRSASDISHDQSKHKTATLPVSHVGNDDTGPNIYGHIYNQLQAREDKHKALLEGLGSLQALDMLVARKYPRLSANGIHVFIDLSNIEIGFRSALRAKALLRGDAQIIPLAQLNFRFLTEALVRGRTTITRSVGCSFHPDHREPLYVRELQNLGYHVDLRKREWDSEWPIARYVEHMVDETLQLRIAESVMEYFQQPGTIVLATGDAQPAQYSDGFFTYTERALRMGWNVELVSWKASLSSKWTRGEWKAKWGNRFRIIQLDKFLDELQAC